jgi:hypothetical protein
MNKTILTILSAFAMLLPTAHAGTHLGQTSAASHVTLVSKTYAAGNSCGMASFSGQNLFRVGIDGIVASTPFTVPSGQYLVVTDVEWTARGGLDSVKNLVANWALRLDINLVKPGNLGTNNLVYQSPGIMVDPMSINGILGASDNLTSGFVVGPGTYICPQAYQIIPNSWIAQRLAKIVLHGYLTN